MKSTAIEIQDKLGNVPFYIDYLNEKIDRSQPHKHNDYYELIFLSQGEGFQWIETEKYCITAPEFYFLKPGQLHQWQFTSVPKGYIIMFKPSYFNAVHECNVLGLCMRLEDKFRVNVPANYTPEPLLNAMLEEFLAPSGFSSKYLHGILMAIISKMLDLAAQQPNEKPYSNTLFDRFLQLIVKEGTRLHLINDYAKLLNTTPQTLNAACKKHSQKNASEHIAAHLMQEAKRYLLHTDNTINEISYILNFNYASYFGKFFKTHEGITPKQFRAKYIE